MSDNAMRQPKTARDHLRALLGALIIVLFPFLLLEALLRVVDPWGIYYFDDIQAMGNDYEPHDQRLYYLPDGEYRYSRWQATVEDGGRLIPATDPDAACKVVLLGDSVTFGYGVNDDEAWANQLAKHFPMIHLVNTGITAYNSHNVLMTHDAFADASAYIYLVINNDWEPTLDPTTIIHRNDVAGLPYIIRYTKFWLLQQQEQAPSQTLEELEQTEDIQRFYDDIATLTSDTRVVLAAFEDKRLTQALVNKGYEPFQVAYPHYPISRSDGHVNAEGNAILAEEMVPLLQQVVDTYCSSAG